MVEIIRLMVENPCAAALVTFAVGMAIAAALGKDVVKITFKD